MMHGVLLIVLIYGIRWQSREPEPVSAELVQSLPPLPQPQVNPPQPDIKPIPRPEPPPTPKPEPKAEPKIEPKPDIAIKKPEPKKKEQKPEPPKEEPKKPEPKPTAKAEPKEKEAKPAPPAEDPMKRLLDQEAKRIDQARVNQQLEREQKRAALAREDATRKADAQNTASALGNARDDWANRIRSKVRSKIALPPGISGNPKAEFELELLPDGSIAREPRLSKSSGIPALDEAIKRAILKSDPLPLPSKTEVFERSLKLVFDPLHD